MVEPIATAVLGAAGGAGTVEEVIMARGALLRPIC
jgi:hypothetical protein